MMTRDQYLALVVTSCINFFCATCVSLQAPFYPFEAEKKGATATEYGLVFGVFELVGFLICPLVGKVVGKLGAKFVLSTGMIISSVSTVLFGQLDRINDHAWFIILSFVIRIIESIGCSSAYVSSFSIIGVMFRDNLASVFGSLEIFYGTGYIVGPFLGGILYSIGGFQLPFAVIGLLSAVAAVLMLLFIPNVTSETCDDLKIDTKKVYTTPEIMISAVALGVFTLSAGFYSAILEPHIRKFHLTPFLTGVVFIVSGVSFAISSPIFGQLMDVIKPKPMLFLGCITNIISFSIVGPLPFLPIPSSLTICVIALVLQGVGFAAGSLAAFAYTFQMAIKYGFPDNFATYGVISGLCTSSYALGAFVGPSAAGILYDLVGFEYSTLFVIFVTLLLMLVEISYMLIEKSKKRKLKMNDAMAEFIRADLPVSKSLSLSITSENGSTLHTNSNYGAI